LIAGEASTSTLNIQIKRHMKSKLLSLFVLTGVSLGAWAQESDSGGFYVKFDVGATLQDDAKVSEFVGIPLSPEVDLEMDPGFRIGLAGGLQLNDSLSLELESGVTYNAIDSIAGISLSGSGVELDIYEVPVLLSLICRIPIGDHFSAYLGGGAGGVFALLEGDESEDDLTFAWQVQAGAEWAIGENLNLGLGYKLLGTGEIDWAGVMTIDSLLTHSVLASLRLEF
jgi:opacity protein-like surface antigen